MEGVIILTSKLAGESEGLLDVADLIARAGTRVGILFAGDGVYSLVEGSKSLRALSDHDPSIILYCCSLDAQARGIGQKVAANVKSVDYDQMVELFMHGFSKVVSYL